MAKKTARVGKSNSVATAGFHTRRQPTYFIELRFNIKASRYRTAAIGRTRKQPASFDKIFKSLTMQLIIRHANAAL